MQFGRSAGVILLLWGPCAFGVAPVMFSEPAHESPVRGAPGDLLLLAGDGFSATDTVVYRAVDNTTQPLVAPSSVAAAAGTAQVVNTLDVPHSLTVALPTGMQADVSYALWVRNEAGEWSNGVLINDARAFWLTPDTVYATAATASLPRQIKIVGRNLQPAPGAVTQVRLHGPADFTLAAVTDDAAIQRYVARVSLPNSMPPGNYSIQLSRDGTSWTALAGQQLTVFPDPAQPSAFVVGAFGGCLPDDGIDDTPCIAAAIAAAKLNGGGAVTFGPGVWDMNYAGALNKAGPVTADGVLVPPGVDLRGAGAGATKIRRGTSWQTATVGFSLQGNNTVQDITFSDANIYQVASTAAPILRLGVRWSAARIYSATDPITVSGVTIIRNTFDKPYIALSDSGMPIDHLLVANNLFGAYFDAILLIGDGNNFNQPFTVADSVFAFNTFAAGSYDNPAASQGAIATQIGGGLRLDFSNNIADGTSRQYLYDPANDAPGWRAGHFWAERGNHEQVLVSQNTATCTGDKAGDGEAIITDGSSLTIGLASAQSVTGATGTTVTIPGPLYLQQLNKALPGGYFIGDWVQITAGTGKGQVRKIVSYPLDSSGQPVTPVTFTVYPAWDVAPQSDSTLVVSREYWQFYIVDNFVDQRQPLCTKGNANKASGGTIGFYAQTADSVIDGNQQYDTSGISLGMRYSVADASLGTSAGISLYSFVDVRGNTVNGEYDWPSSCSWGGIQVTDGASPTIGFPPPIEGYGISIGNNTVTHADGLHGGAIDLVRGWSAGPAPGNWPMVDNTLVFGNSINDMTGAPTQQVTGPLPYATSSYKQCSNEVVPRIAIHPADVTVRHTVLSGNACVNVDDALLDQGTQTISACGSPGASTCECAIIPPTDGP